VKDNFSRYVFGWLLLFFVVMKNELSLNNLFCCYQVSFVNSIATIKGGTHVDYVTSQITNHIVAAVNKKNKNANVKAHNVKNHLWVFVNALIDNPAFDSQTKETLTLRQSSFGSKCELSEDFLKKGMVCSICLFG